MLDRIRTARDEQAPGGPLAERGVRATCDTCTRTLRSWGSRGRPAPPEPELQHVRAVAHRGWRRMRSRTPSLRRGGRGARSPPPSRRSEHSDGRAHAVALSPDRPVAEADVRAAESSGRFVGPVTIDTTPQEHRGVAPLDEDFEGTPPTVRLTSSADFSAATQAALVLSPRFGAVPGPPTPVNAWWGTFDLAVSLFPRVGRSTCR